MIFTIEGIDVHTVRFQDSTTEQVKLVGIDVHSVAHLPRGAVAPLRGPLTREELAQVTKVLEDATRRMWGDLKAAIEVEEPST